MKYAKKDNYIYWVDIHPEERLKYKLSRKSRYWNHPSRGMLRIEHGLPTKQNVIARHRRLSGTTL